MKNSKHITVEKMRGCQSVLWLLLIFICSQCCAFERQRTFSSLVVLSDIFCMQWLTVIF